MTAPAFSNLPDPPKRPTVVFCSDEKPRCPHGHRLTGQTRVTTDGIIRCGHRDPRSKLRCDTLIWVALVTFGGSAKVRGTGERVWLVVDVSSLSYDDITQFTTSPMTLLERLAYLGHTMPGVDLDLFGGATE